MGTCQPGERRRGEGSAPAPLERSYLPVVGVGALAKREDRKGAMDWTAVGFWLGLLVPVVSYVLYPFSVIALGRFARRPPATSKLTWPSISVVIAAHNEENSISRAVRSILNQRYPGPMSVIVGLDGCTDGTADALASIDDPRLTVLDLPRAGKATTDNRLVKASDGEVVVTTSAGSEFGDGALARLVEPFRDPRVGCSTGVFRPRPDGTDSGQGEGLYWRFEYAVMEAESRLGLLAMASGTALAFRRAMFHEIPIDSDADVVVAPTIALQGGRVVHVPAAIVFDDGPSSFGFVLRSRRRMALRALPATVALVPRLIAAGRIGPAIGLVAHKVFRWLTPVAAIIWLISSAAILARPSSPYAPPVVAVLAAIALVGSLSLLDGRLRGAVVSLALAQLAFGLALVDVLRGRRARMWTREPE